MWRCCGAGVVKNAHYEMPDGRRPKPEEHFHETLDLGDLRDICRIRML
jgi:hypothetical protein